ncbi:hypothetical protein BH11BAC7_BH11BAC7_17600 [soil metagenome]
MENHDHNGHGESHDDHATEGNRQYYPKGWWMPLAGLVTVALGFCIIGYFAFNVSGTDKWGQREETGIHDALYGDDAEGHTHNHGGKDDYLQGHANNNNVEVKEAEGLMKPIDSAKQDSMAEKAKAAGEHH